MTVGAGDVVAVDVHDEIERLDEDPAHDVLGDVLARHQRRVHERVHRIGRAVGVHRAQEANLIFYLLHLNPKFWP